MSSETIAAQGQYYEPERRLPESGLHVLAVVNEYSSNYADAMAQFEALRAAGFVGAQDIVRTERSWQDTAGRIGEKLIQQADGDIEPYDVIAIFAGDGTGNAIARGAHYYNQELLGKTPLMFRKGGGACDIHHMTQETTQETTRAGEHSYLDQLAGQAVRELTPLELTVETLDGEVEREELIVAHGCAGNMGEIAYGVNGRPHRDSWLLRRGVRQAQMSQEFITATKSVDLFDRFYVSEPGDDKPRLVSDIVVTNGNQMGRRRWFPGDIFEPGYHEVSAPNLPMVLAVAGQLAIGNTAVMAPRMMSEYVITPRKLGRDVLIQFDGETFRLPAQRAGKAPSNVSELARRVKIQVSDRPLQVATPYSGQPTASRPTEQAA